MNKTTNKFSREVRERVVRLVRIVPCAHHGIHASKLAEKASTKHGAIQFLCMDGRF